MFDKAIIDTDRFMDLSMAAKALYFLLGMEADDEGFVSYKKVMRIHGGNEDDIKILVVKKFALMFDSGVVVITDWNKNNYLDKNRIRNTEYQREKAMLLLTKDGNYEFNTGLTSIEEYRGVERSTEQAGGKATPVASKSQKDYTNEFEKFWLEYPKKVGKPKTFMLWKKLAIEDKEKIMLDLPLRKADKKWIGGYIKDPERYIKNQQWLDEIIKVENKKAAFIFKD